MATVTKTALTDSQKTTIQNFVDQWEKFSNAYFWKSPSSASARRSYEQYNSREMELDVDGMVYHGSIQIHCSCANIYVTRELTIDGETKRITALKNLLK